ncbi:division/cell wall cluster transcriptional repressor MraZ [Candidatus Microgenomates bacterium]|nr:division/cell wall cluster transcriptional repressor MraZ [Candidatus Microgenomates bacterium]
MLLGYYVAGLDEKWRLAVPARIRHELGRELVVSRWYEGCLLLISRSIWGEMVARLTGGELATLSSRDTDRFLLAGSFEIELDKQGRFVVPQGLRAYAHLEDAVIFAGLGDRIEIWDKKSWDERESTLIKEAGEKVEKLYRERRERT